MGCYTKCSKGSIGKGIKVSKPLWKTAVTGVAAAGLLTGCLFNVSTHTCSACGAATSAQVSGRAVDGYIAYATVTLDVNDDRICDASEPSTLTDSTGYYSFSSGGNHMVCLTGGTDLSTGQPFIGTLLAPAGATVITPLTTLVMQQLNAGNPPVRNHASPIDHSTAASAAATLRDQLGLGNDVSDLLSTDPQDQAGSHPNLLRTTMALQAALVQSVSILQASGGQDTAEAGNTDTNLLYNDASAALASLLSQTQSQLSTGTLGTLAPSLIVKAAQLAQQDPLLTSDLPALQGLDPRGIGSFAGPVLNNLMNAVISSDAASLSLANQYNRGALAIGSVIIPNTVSALAPYLFTAGSGISSTALASLSAAALPVGSNGLPKAAPAAVTLQALVTLLPSIQLPPSAIAALGSANQLHNATSVADLHINCAVTCGPSALLYDAPVIGSPLSVGAFTNVIVSLAAPTGVATGGTPSSLIPTGTGAGQALPGTQFDSSFRIDVSSLNPGDNRKLNMLLDHLVLYQTTVLDANNNPYVALRAAIPDGAKLTLSGTGNSGVSSTSVMGAATARGLFSMGALVAPGTTNSDVRLDIFGLLVRARKFGTQFPLLTDFNSSLAGSNKKYLVSVSYSGLHLTTSSRFAPARTHGYSVVVNF